MASASVTVQTEPMISSRQLLDRLTEMGAKRALIASVLGVDPSAVTLMFAGKRRIRLDEARLLVDHFQLADDQAAELDLATIGLLVQHVADAVGVPLADGDPLVGTLSAELQSFIRFGSPAARQASSRRKVSSGLWRLADNGTEDSFSFCSCSRFAGNRKYPIQ